jgi:hypothetical protein
LSTPAFKYQQVLKIELLHCLETRFPGCSLILEANNKDERNTEHLRKRVQGKMQNFSVAYHGRPSKYHRFSASFALPIHVLFSDN